MISPFETLGLADDADARQVKRSYARLLRSHRPDEDPVAFQRLHEAYEACLQYVAWRDAEHGNVRPEDQIVVALPDAMDEAITGPNGCAWGSSDPSGTPRSTSTGPSAVVERIEPPHGLPFGHEFHMEAFIHELATRLQHDSATAIADWLQGHEDLYSLDLKRSLRPAVVEVIGSLPTRTSIAGQDAIKQTIAFFGLDSVSRGDEWLHHSLDTLRQRQEDLDRFEGHLRRYASPHAKWTDRQIVQELTRPLNPLRRLFLGLVPGLPSRVAALVRELQERDPESAGLRLDQGNVAFWLQAMDRSMLRRPRLAIAGTRLVLWTLLPAAYAAPYVNTYGRLVNWGLLAGALGIVWLGYSLATMGMIRLQRYNQAHLQWDNATFGLGIGAIISSALLLWHPFGLVSFAITGILWVGFRGDGGSAATQSQWATIAAALSTLMFGMTLSMLAGDEAPRLRYALIGTSLYTLAVLAWHDVAWARRKRIPLAHAHFATGWLWWVAASHAAVAVLMLANMSS